MAAPFLELLFPPGRSFEGPGLVPLLANPLGGFGIGIDFEVGFGGHEFYLPLPLLTLRLRSGQAKEGSRNSTIK